MWHAGMEKDVATGFIPAPKLWACMLLLGSTLASTDNTAIWPRQQTCPVIKIVCWTEEQCRGPKYTFAVAIAGGYSDREPSFKWSVSAGTITSGQGTGEIEVNGGGVTDKPLTVSIEVGNIIPDGCPATESYTVEHAKSSNPPAKTHPRKRKKHHTPGS